MGPSKLDPLSMGPKLDGTHQIRKMCGWRRFWNRAEIEQFLDRFSTLSVHFWDRVAMRGAGPQREARGSLPPTFEKRIGPP